MARRGRKPGSHHNRPCNAGIGRKKGVPNKATAAAREAIAMFVEGNVHRLEGWLDQISKSRKYGPKVAFDAFMSVVEYHVPKLARTEVIQKPSASDPDALTDAQLEAIAARPPAPPAPTDPTKAN